MSHYSEQYEAEEERYRNSPEGRRRQAELDKQYKDGMFVRDWLIKQRRVPQHLAPSADTTRVLVILAEDYLKRQR
jgi:hypothetical protein